MWHCYKEKTRKRRERELILYWQSVDTIRLWTDILIASADSLIALADILIVFINTLILLFFSSSSPLRCSEILSSFSFSRHSRRLRIRSFLTFPKEKTGRANRTSRTNRTLFCERKQCDRAKKRREWRDYYFFVFLQHAKSSNSLPPPIWAEFTRGCLGRTLSYQLEAASAYRDSYWWILGGQRHSQLLQYRC